MGYKVWQYALSDLITLCKAESCREHKQNKMVCGMVNLALLIKIFLQQFDLLLIVSTVNDIFFLLASHGLIPSCTHLELCLCYNAPIQPTKQPRIRMNSAPIQLVMCNVLCDWDCAGNAHVPMAKTSMLLTGRHAFSCSPVKNSWVLSQIGSSAPDDTSMDRSLSLDEKYSRNALHAFSCIWNLRCMYVC